MGCPPVCDFCKRSIPAEWCPSWSVWGLRKLSEWFSGDSPDWLGCVIFFTPFWTKEPEQIVMWPSTFQNSLPGCTPSHPKPKSCSQKDLIKASHKLTAALQECTCCQESLPISSSHSVLNQWLEVCQSQPPPTRPLMSVGWGLIMEEEEEVFRNSRRDSNFQPQVSFCDFGLHLASAASLHEGTSAIKWQTWHQTRGPDCSRWINVTWIKSRNEWPGLLQLGAQPMSELIGLSKKEPCCLVAGFVVFVNHLWQAGGSKLN